MTFANPFAPEGDDEAIVATINTTPLVDIMLVLLIIFLITIPVVVHTVPVALPHETIQPTQTRPENIVIAVDKDGVAYWNDARIAEGDALLDRLKARAGEDPQPEVHIRADMNARYGSVGRIVAACQRAGIVKVAFITEPERSGAPGQ